MVGDQGPAALFKDRKNLSDGALDLLMRQALSKLEQRRVELEMARAADLANHPCGGLSPYIVAWYSFHIKRKRVLELEQRRRRCRGPQIGSSQSSSKLESGDPRADKDEEQRLEGLRDKDEEQRLEGLRFEVRTLFSLLKDLGLLLSGVERRRQLHSAQWRFEFDEQQFEDSVKVAQAASADPAVVQAGLDKV